MKMILVCPGQRSAVGFLTESAPLISLPLLGESMVECWLTHLAGQGVKEARIVVTDRPEQVAALLGEGHRWGVRVEVIPELRELSVEEARERHHPAGEADWPPAPADAVMMDHLPDFPGRPLFQSYADWFAGLMEWMPLAGKDHRIGVKEIRPGVWCGRKTQISASARIIGPCWIGENVSLGPQAVIGPNVVLENQVVVDKASEIVDSWVGPETFVGTLTKIENSLAWGNLLINWQTGSHTHVPDAFLMCSLVQNPSLRKSRSLSKRVSSAFQIAFGKPEDPFAPMRGKLQAE